MIEQRLTQLGYRPGEPDGVYDAATASAVMAFQKHEGLERDGVAGPQTQLALLAPIPAGAGPRLGDGGPRVEIDLDRQIAFFIAADRAVSILNVSTGNGQAYRVPGGGTGVARTPTGQFAVYRRVDAVEHAPLGILYRPLYFTGGFAVHGSTSVPGHPASHGCVRVSNADQDWLFPQAGTGTPVLIYAGTSVAPPDPGISVGP